MYFDEKVVTEKEYEGPLATTSSVLQGLMTFADVTSGKINVRILYSFIPNFPAYVTIRNDQLYS